MTNPRTSPAMLWAFTLLMLALNILFVALGIWQLQRLAEKEALVAAVEERLHLPPAPPPPVTDWQDLDPAALNFTPLTLVGHFTSEAPIRVFTALPASTARGSASGPGYWIVAPFVLETGGTVFVNLGFVPQQLAQDFAEPDVLPQGQIILTGLACAPEEASLFTPAPDTANRIEWVRDPVRLAALVDPAFAPFAPFTLDRAAGEPGTLPQGGETVVEFPNNHLGYAITWFGFALITPLLLAVWLWRQRRH